MKALVTGASTGIGQATVRALSAQGWDAIAVARREERLTALAAETGCDYLVLDLTDEQAVHEAVGAKLGKEPLDLLAHIAGGAFGAESVESGKPADWLWMYQINVLATLHLAQAALPALRRSENSTLLFLTSTAGYTAYEGGGGYVAAKHAERTMAQTMRLELAGERIRVMELAPGLVETEEFALNRFGDATAAKQVYAGVDNPLTAEDVANTLVWMVSQPAHVNVDSLVLRPLAQAAQHKLIREPLKQKRNV